MNKLKKIMSLMLLILSVLMAYFLLSNCKMLSFVNKLFFVQIKKQDEKQINQHIKNLYIQQRANRQNMDYMIFDKNQNPLVDEKFDNISSFNSDKTVFLVSKQGKQGLVNADGSYLLPVEYRSIINFIPSEGIIKAVDFGGKKGTQILFNKNAEEIFRADSIQKTYNHIVAFFSDEKTYKILDTKLNVLMSFSTSPRFINEEYILIKDGTNLSVIDINGNEIISDDYNEIYFCCKNNDKEFFKVKKLFTEYGIVDEQNNITVPCLFNSITNVEDGFWAKKIYKKLSKNKKETITVEKWAKFDFEGQYIKNPDSSEIKNLNNLTGKINVDRNISDDDNDVELPIRKIINVSKKTQNKNKEELLSIEEIEELKKQAEADTKFLYADEKPKPENQPVHKSNYKSDFLSSKLNGKFTKLNCSLEPGFCKLSKNALSAKYCGKEGYYLADKELTFGKYYFEFQIENSNGKELSPYSKFSLFRFVKYKTASDAQRYKNNWKYNKTDINLNSYKIKPKDIVGVAIDMNNARVHIMVNGEWKSNPYSPSEGVKLVKVKNYNLGFSIAGYNEVLTVNLGTKPFKYSMPDGYRAIDKSVNNKGV
ncbi:MAG: WG repeat-containing protein [Candidatus Avigastranaerophilus sp.]